MDFGGAILPPEFALSFDVYKGFQVSPPPDIGIRMIRHDAQNTVLPGVFEPFPGSPPRTRIARENFLKSMVFLYVYKGFLTGISDVKLVLGSCTGHVPDTG